MCYMNTGVKGPKGGYLFFQDHREGTINPTGLGSSFESGSRESRGTAHREGCGDSYKQGGNNQAR